MAQVLRQAAGEKSTRENALEVQSCVKCQGLCKLNAVNVISLINIRTVDLGDLQHFSVTGTVYVQRLLSEATKACDVL